MPFPLFCSVFSFILNVCLHVDLIIGFLAAHQTDYLHFNAAGISALVVGKLDIILETDEKLAA